ncbi:AAA family ATPase [Niastella populi]|uniref:Chromosome segregation protein SMC n=1 Tax=Niastella populi TaxID=550983 RepID=A0A1V9FTB3_9BACT|nr:AAA family ATPase [Niastella populi]OQP61570.1 chromosome segregation protein SMC [Niastella populi]
MRIRKLHLKNFKRFTDLTIDNIPDEAKLVLLIGSNGSGKSSIFDAFGYAVNVSRGRDNDAQYYFKNLVPSEISIFIADGGKIEILGGVNRSNNLSIQKAIRKFIGRSSNRIVPRISQNAYPEKLIDDSDRPATFIDADTRFDNDLFGYMQRIDNALREPVFAGKSADTLKIFQEQIQPFNDSLIKIFGGDATTTIQIAEFQNATPSAPGKLIFKKGNSKINYDLLSHGEKQVVILLLNFIVRRQFYSDAIIFIDEMDCHLNTALQSTLLKEIVDNWIPDNAQLWTASHALGFIDYARQSDNAVILDFDLLNFDIPQVVKPQPKDSLEVLNIAIPKEVLKKIFKDYKLVVVENQNDEYFTLALGEKGYLFLPAKNNREVFLTIKGDKDKIGLRDRDYLKPEEVEAITKKYPNLKILKFYTFENYLYHPDNVEELKLANFSKADYLAEIINQKNERLLDIVEELATSRQTYVEFKEDGIKDDKNVKPITAAIKSDDFDVFYVYFNMKRYYNKTYLQQFNIQPKDLVKTNWFKKQIEDILNS